MRETLTGEWLGNGSAVANWNAGSRRGRVRLLYARFVRVVAVQLTGVLEKRGETWQAKQKGKLSLQPVAKHAVLVLANPALQFAASGNNQPRSIQGASRQDREGK